MFIVWVVGLCCCVVVWRCVSLCLQVARTANGTIIPDPVRFPSGMRALADFLHSKVCLHYVRVCVSCTILGSLAVYLPLRKSCLSVCVRETTRVVDLFSVAVHRGRPY